MELDRTFPTPEDVMNRGQIWLVVALLIGFGSITAGFVWTHLRDARAATFTVRQIHEYWDWQGHKLDHDFNRRWVVTMRSANQNLDVIAIGRDQAMSEVHQGSTLTLHDNHGVVRTGAQWAVINPGTRIPIQVLLTGTDMDWGPSVGR